MENLGSGLASMAFWLSLAAIVVAAIWAANRKKQSQYQTVHRLIESGQEVDPDLIRQLLATNTTETKHQDLGLRISGIIMGFVAIGFVPLGFFVGQEEPGALYPILGSACLIGSIALGLFIAGKVAKRTLDVER